ncbi:MAG: hypothetical protein K2K15_01355, partial [Anaeroplasmataceae bacterium]|nr:hypothetical protein [Anaeroplasmataceae bacterium]
EYNQAYEEKLSATSIEGYSLIYIVDAEEYGVYLDFNDDNGYLVTTLSYKLYKIEVSGDLDYLKGEEFFYYSVQDGFLYLENGIYYKYDETIVYNNQVYEYAGQVGNGEANILNIEYYVADRYPSYSLAESNEKILETGRMITEKMSSFNYYIKHISHDGGYTYPDKENEVNCSITAAFNVMINWRDMAIYPGLPSYKWKIDVRTRIPNDPDYETYGFGTGGVGKDYYWTKNDDSALESMPEMFVHLRQHARNTTSYRPDHGMNINEIQSVMLATYLDYHMNPITINQTTSFANVVTSLANMKAVYMGINNSISYQTAHAVAVLGYYKYTYETGWWIFSSTETAYFYAICDGQGMYPYSYFDPNCNSRLSFEFLYV